MKQEKLTGIRIKFDDKPLSEQEQKESKGWAVPKELCTHIVKDSDNHSKLEIGDVFLFLPDKATKVWKIEKMNQKIKRKH